MALKWKGALRAVLGVSLVAVAATCSGSEKNGPSPVTATHAVDGAQGSACTKAGARDLVERFLADETSDVGQLVATFIAPEPLFQWFSTRDRLGPQSTGRSSLAAYLEERRRRGVRQRLETFNFSGTEVGHTNFTFVIAESSGAGRVVYPGKGAIDCRSGRFIVWSEGSPF